MKIRLQIILRICFTLCLASAGGSVAATVRTGVLFGSEESVVSTYNCFCRDSDGYLWIATEHGLMRFDGNNYDVYRHDQQDSGSLSDNRTIDLLCDSKERLWVATANGLNLYDRVTDTFRLVEVPSEGFNGYITSLAEKLDGSIVFIFSGQGLYVVDDSDPSRLTAVRYLPQSYHQKALNFIECTPNGRIYAGDNLGNVHIIYPNGQHKSVKVGNSYVREIVLEADGNLIVNILNDIFRVDVATLEYEKLTIDSEINVSTLSTTTIDGKIFIGTSGNGIWSVSPGDNRVSRTTEFYSPFVNVNGSRVSAIYGGDDGRFWIACDYHGILMIRPHQDPFVYRKMNDYYSDFIGGISAICGLNESVVVAVDNERLAMLSVDGKLMHTYQLPVEGTVTCIVPEQSGRVLVGLTNRGVWELSLSDGRWQRLMDIPGDYPSIHVNTDGKNDIFVAVHGIGVMRYDRSTGRSAWLDIDPEGNQLTNAYVNHMARSDDGKLWIGTYSGLSCYDLAADSLIAIDQEPFRQGATNYMVPLDDGLLLVATSHGLIEYSLQKGVVGKYTTADGLTDNDVRTIAVDQRGGRWIGTMRGLSYQNSSTRAISSYYGSYGLVENSFRRSTMSGSDGMVFLAGDLGITSFDPQAVPPPLFKSEIKVSAIFLNGEKVSPCTRIGRRNVIEGNPMKPDVIDLPYSDNAMSIRLSTMDFRDASNVVYRWRVKDIIEDWIKTMPGENMIYLPYLEPGIHILQFCGEENGVLSPMTEIRIRVTPPWYLSLWAKLLYFLIMVTLLTLGWKLIQKKREEKLNDEKIKYFIDVSHDIRSPITLILSPLESLLKRPFDDDVRKQLKMMHRNGQRILSLVNQMLDVRRLDKGKMSLSCRRTNLSSFVGELVEMFKTQALENGLSLNYESKSEIGYVWIDRDTVDKILVNLISNAIKYTPKGGEITVATERVDDAALGQCVQISVVDTGIGLDSKLESKIFERFYRNMDNHSSGIQGFGIGLDLCRRLAELHHGSIMGKNRADGVRGSIFTIRLPMDPYHYAPDELHEFDGGSAGVDNSNVRQLAVSALSTNPMKGEYSAKKRTRQLYTVLMVDDHEELREYLCGQLASSYKVLEAADGEEALKVILDKAPDVIVSDIIMPKMDGMQLLKSIKSNSATSHIPVILLSSKNEVADRMAGWSRGADGYLGKPFIYDELEMLIDTLIENRLRVKGRLSGLQETEEMLAVPEVKGNDEKLMEKIGKIVEKYVDDSDFNVEKLSEEAGISRAHLHRKMKDVVGMNPSDFIRNIRLRRACELLQKPDIEITQIAYLVGYTSQPHFSTAFKKFTGYTPSEYRSRAQAGSLPVEPEK